MTRETEVSPPPPDPAVKGSTYAPSMLDLVRLSRRPLFPPGGEELYRQIALLTGMKADQEVLDVACGIGVTLSYFVEEFGVQGFGVDFDAQLVEQAEKRARESDLRGPLQFQQAPLDKLPYRDEIFDVVVGELGLAAHADPADAVRELVRVTRPGGRIVLIQLVWKAPVDPDRRRILTGHLGAHPLMLVEWKRLLREANVEKLHTEAWSDEETAFRPQVKKPFPDFAELFTLPEKLGILRRAWGRWGWYGVRTAVAREMEVHRLLTRERILGLDLVIGQKAESETAEPVPEAGERAAAEVPESGMDRKSNPENGTPEGASEGPADLEDEESEAESPQGPRSEHDDR
ncbi:MAG: methyltransferase domain-containing protein [Gemmatimonadota bacterium]